MGYDPAKRKATNTKYREKNKEKYKGSKMTLIQ